MNQSRKQDDAVHGPDRGFRVIDRRWAAEAGVLDELKRPPETPSRPGAQAAAAPPALRVVEKRRVSMSREEIAGLGRKRPRAARRRVLWAAAVLGLVAALGLCATQIWPRRPPAAARSAPEADLPGN